MRFLVTAGPTREWIDPIRYISNASSGKMGYEMARQALKRNHTVILISGPTNLRPPHRVQTVFVETALQMHSAVLHHLPETDALVMTAAVADFRPARKSSRKIRRKSSLTLKLLPNPDILADAARIKRSHQVFVGFALEDSINAIENALRKLKTKHLDLVVLNTKQTIGAERSTFILITKDKKMQQLECTKRTLAAKIVRFVEEALGCDTT